MTGFDPATFVNRIGRRLVREFEDAAEAGTPSLVGAAREHPARTQLAKLLPAFMAVSSGLVIDTFGGLSTQQDIVLYERDFCPVYSVNDTPEATYFPVEGVAACGEVKSVASKAVLFDALAKANSAKALRRYSEPKSSDVGGALASWRPYGQTSTFAPTPEDAYSQTQRPSDEVYTFILCQSFAQSPDTVLGNLIEWQRLNGLRALPNLIVSLADGFIQAARVDPQALQLQVSPVNADGLVFAPAPDRAFAYLVNDLRRHVRQGRSVPLSTLDRYMASVTDDLPSAIGRRFEIEGDM